MASIKVFRNQAKPQYWLHICGGCLISLKHILSAAQCIIMLKKKFKLHLKHIAAHVGDLDLKGPSKPHYIIGFHEHNGYDENDASNTAVNDIGVTLVSL